MIDVAITPNQTPTPTQIFITIPARLSSTRLPEKPLQDLQGKTMIARVTQRALTFAKMLEQSPLVSKVTVLVATDDMRIAKSVQNEGGNAALTSPDLRSGTDRIFAALAPLQPGATDLIVNIQGDEPFFSFRDVGNLIQKMITMPNVPMGTLAFKRNSWAHFMKSSVVKVICDAHSRAVYFTRAPAPWPRAQLGASGNEWLHTAPQGFMEEPFLHHLGVYAYRFDALHSFAQKLPKSTLEETEGLEQLRAIEAGWHIALVVASEEPFGIDTPEDLTEAQQVFHKKWSECTI